MIGEALTQKESLIEELEKELAVEKARRMEMNKRFDEQVKEFTEEQRALREIRSRSKKLEAGKLDKRAEGRKLDEDLDRIPTKETSTSQKPAARTPKKPATTFNQSRVKSSIPGQSASVQKMIAAREKRKTDQQKADYLDELKKQEVKRAIRLEEEQEMTQTVLEKMRDNPNAQLHHMHTEVGMLNRKIEPLLQRVEQATAMVKSAGHHQSLSSQPGPVGMLSRMGGRLISFYADDLADLLLEDFLTETATDLQRIEKLTRKQYAEKETEQLANNILQELADYQAEEQLVDMRWSNKAVQREIKSLGLGGISRQPKPIEINLNRDLVEASAGEQMVKFDESAMADASHDKLQQSYQNPFERADTFMKTLTEQTKSKPALAIDGAATGGESALIKRKWRIDIDKERLRSIEEGRERYDKYLKLHNNTSNKQVWKVYDHIAADLMADVLAEIMGTIDKDLDKFCEKVIYDEF